jgi:hypothetical protein
LFATKSEKRPGGGEGRLPKSPELPKLPELPELKRDTGAAEWNAGEDGDES